MSHILRITFTLIDGDSCMSLNFTLNTPMDASVEIIGTESLGVRGLSCFIKTRHHKILIDPGVALGYLRHGLLPHPIQIARGVLVRKKLFRP